MHLQPTYPFPMFDSLQIGTCAPAAITTIVGGEVAIVSFAAACYFFDDSMIPRAAVVLPRVAERRRGVAKRRSRRLLPRRSAAAIISRPVRVVHASPATQASLRRRPTVCALRSWQLEKKCTREWSFCGHSCMPVRSLAC